MRLLRLEVKGFKSFADETVLHFSEDVIGVVGPNGAGKSNVVDAIRWVLGEQKSKELRLERMSDVIFNGTKKRKEAGMAQVTLVFDNDRGLLPTEYQQVSISRLLYRSGESEYRLNNVPCRLKDVQSLFLDTGIGSNSYAIIALGMVDDILADKEHARRRMFEQAAGISKYKKRKKETLSKLKSTAADLDRVEDLLFEIEGNLKMLEKQAKRTKKYFELKQEYKEIAVQYALHEVTTYKDKYKDLEHRLSGKQDDYRKLETAITTAEADIQQVKADNISIEEQLSAKQKELAKMVNAIQSLQSDKALAKQQIDFLEQTDKQLLDNIQRSIQDLQQAQKASASQESRVVQEQVTLQSMLSDKLAAEEKYTSTKATYQKAKDLSDQVAKELQQIDQEVYNAEKDSAVLQNTIDNKQQSIVQQKQRLDLREQAFTSVEIERQQLTEQRSLQQSKVDQLEVAVTQRSSKIDELQQSINEVQNEHSDVSRRLDSSTNEYELLKSMIESFEGFPESVRFLSKEWDSKVPILSDVLDVEDQYRAVIEQYLEPYLNHYIVADVGVAAEAIRLLTSSQMGKAHFFLLDQLSKQGSRDIVIANSLPAISVVHCEDRYQSLLEHLLADVYILEGSIDDFKYLASYQDCDFLAASGTFIKRSKSISGGSVGLFEGKKIGRKKNLEKLQKAIAKYDDQKTHLLGKLSALREHLNAIKADDPAQSLRDHTHELQRIEQNLTRHSVKADEYAKFRQTAIDQINTLTADIATAEGQLSDLRKRIDTYRAAREAKVSSPGTGQLDIDALASEMTAASEAYNASNVAVIRQGNLVETLTKDYKYQRSRAEELERRIIDLKAQRESNNSKAIQQKEALESITDKLLQLSDQRKDRDTALSDAEQRYFALRNKVTEQENAVRLKHRQRNQLQAEVQQMREDFTALKFQINAIGDRLKIEFAVSLNDIINDEIDTSISIDDLQEKVERLKKRLGNYGEINPMALEAYDEMKIRYLDITSQRDDILEAKESLIKTIDEIETTATAKYLEAFEAVRINFINVFRSLFTEEDNCNLILLDPDHPLDSGIDIIAKPKGKKPVSLSQLSGGEKTLTATALLFALYLLKPAPFCIFDEVDAPLDDANIQKFNKIIKKFSGDSQFIIVTHNKSTMAAVDVLYGVYMQEQGVSGVSAVDFRNYDHQEIVQQAG